MCFWSSITTTFQGFWARKKFAFTACCHVMTNRSEIGIVTQLFSAMIENINCYLIYTASKWDSCVLCAVNFITVVKIVCIAAKAALAYAEVGSYLLQLLDNLLRRLSLVRSSNCYWTCHPGPIQVARTLRGHAEISLTRGQVLRPLVSCKNLWVTRTLSSWSRMAIRSPCTSKALNSHSKHVDVLSWAWVHILSSYVIFSNKCNRISALLYMAIRSRHKHLHHKT